MTNSNQGNQRHLKKCNYNCLKADSVNHLKNCEFFSRYWQKIAEKKYKCKICSYQVDRLIRVINHIKSIHPLKNDATYFHEFSKHIKKHLGKFGDISGK